MKAESNILPQQIMVESHDGMADVVLSENIVLIDRDSEQFYQYDQYRVTARNRPNLQADIETHFADWIAYAKGKEAETPPLTLPQKVDLHDAEIGDIVMILEAIV